MEPNILIYALHEFKVTHYRLKFQGLELLVYKLYFPYIVGYLDIIWLLGTFVQQFM